MADLKPQSAARLSEDIGDVLTAIRRLIAEDEALVAARDRLAAERVSRDGIIDEDSADFLARRYGGNAALARRLAQSSPRPEPAQQHEGWPLGQLANAPDAARPSAAPAMEAPQPRNQLARILSSQSAAATDQPDMPVSPRRDGQPVKAQTTAEPPLRLEPERRADPALRVTVPEFGWRSAIRAELPLGRYQPAPGEAGDAGRQAARAFAAMVDDEDDFAEAFDWKARMRPDPEKRASSSQPEIAQASQPVASLNPQRSGRATEPAGPLADAAGHDDACSGSPLSAKPATGGAGGAGVVTITGLSPEDEEQSIRELLREMIQAELHGELGQRFSGNLRAVIRREVAAAIDDQLDRL